MTKYDELAIGQKIGLAIARDVIADGLDREWDGLTAEDGDCIPDEIAADEDAVERVEEIAKAAYLAAIERHDGQPLVLGEFDNSL